MPHLPPAWTPVPQDALPPLGGFKWPLSFHSQGLARSSEASAARPLLFNLSHLFPSRPRFKHGVHNVKCMYIVVQIYRAFFFLQN